uniref:Uncharacterized protein n=1 Tax=Triticum urartu TaxID=4572 RepID=A0A8R7RAK9_TRIUA
MFSHLIAFQQEAGRMWRKRATSITVSMAMATSMGGMSKDRRLVPTPKSGVAARSNINLETTSCMSNGVPMLAMWVNNGRRPFSILSWQQATILATNRGLPSTL